MLELWDEKPNLANHEEIIEYLHSCSRRLSKPLYKYLHQISIAQLELEPYSEEEIDIYKIIGIHRTVRLDSDKA